MKVLAALAVGARRRLPLVLQTEAAECGLACVAMIASYHGRRIDLAVLRRRHGVSMKGATLASLRDVAQRLGLATRAVRLELDEIGALRTPCILHFDLDHFVVLKRARRRAWIVLDPAAGERRLTPAEASRSFTGVALELWPEADFVRGEERERVRLRALMGRVTGLFRSFAQILLLAAAIEVFVAVSPLYLQWVIDHALPAANRDLLTTLALGFGLLVVFRHTVAALRSWVIMHIGAVLSVQWQANVLDHLLRLPMPYFEKRHLGDIVSRFRSVEVIQRTLTTAFVEAIVDGVMTIVVLVVVYLYSPLLATVALAAVALYGFVRWIGYRPLRRATEEQIVHAARQESHFFETARGIRSIKLFGRRHERREAWLELLVRQMNAGLRAQKLQIAHRLANGLTFGLENVLVVWLGARLVLDNELSVGMLMAFMSYKEQLSTRVGALIDRLVELRMLRIQGERLADIVLTEPEPSEGTNRLALEHAAPGRCGIEIRGLRFRYAEHEPYVLDGVDLMIAPGESVVIVGPSGCGKTTLLHVLLGMLPPTEGTVLVGGRDIRAIDAETLRRTIGCVMQNDTLFAGSIADNISFFDPLADQQRIETCAKLASVHAEIVSMPMAYNTFVGYMGSVLSGGQQQRILLARALYKQPSILILDEATSHLDVKREILVGAAIRELEMTRVIVAHRPQTAATADRVVTLSGGKIVKDTLLVSRRGLESGPLIAGARVEISTKTRESQAARDASRFSNGSTTPAG